MPNSLYVYGICLAADFSQEAGTGLGGEPLSIVADEKLAAVISRVHLSGQGTAAAVQAHADVCERIFRRSAILPARFGTRAGSAEDLLAHLQVNQQRYIEALAWTENKVEIGLRIQPKEKNPIVPTSDCGRTQTGAEYLKARARTPQVGDQFIPDHILSLHSQLVSQSAESKRTRTRDQTTCLSAAYLIGKESVDEVCEFARRAASRLPEWRVILTGPWPPYHFAGGCGHA